MLYSKAISYLNMIYAKKFGAHPKRVSRNPNCDGKVMTKF
jgi:hypothetical protein